MFENNVNYKYKKSLIIYFSRADENYAVGYIDKGNTEVIAEYIKELTNADMIKIEPLNQYPKDYNTCIEEAKKRQSSHNAPIVNEVGDITSYEVIYIGAPVYWNLLPEEMVTALKDLDLTGKIIRPFTTHEGSKMGNIKEQLQTICKGADVKEGVAIKGSLVYNSKDQIESWV